jgi:hypothetical protein
MVFFVAIFYFEMEDCRNFYHYIFNILKKSRKQKLYRTHNIYFYVSMWFKIVVRLALPGSLPLAYKTHQLCIQLFLFIIK